MSLFRVEISSDRLKVHAVAVKAGTDKAVAARDLPRALGALGVRHGFVEDALAGLMSAAEGAVEGARVLVAEGQPARAGADGRLEFIVDASNRAQYAEKADGSLDFRETNLVHAVREGEALAVVHPPAAGVPGRNVFGEALPAKAGSPARLQLGPNVAAGSGSRQLVAKAAGRVLFDGVKLSVEPVMTVPGDVDYSVGNIRFPGFLTVRGSVLDGFEVEAARGVEIGGVAGACTVRSDGDVTVRGGVNGHNKAVIEAGGSVRAKYLNEAVVRSHGDVEVATETVNSRVYCLGRLLARRGAVIGGEVVARCGVEAQTLGSELGVPTRITIGKDYDVSARLEAATARAAVIDAELPGLVKRLEAMADRKKFLAMAEAERERVKAEYEKFKGLKAERLKLEESLKSLAAQMRPPAEPPEVRVSGLLYQDVTVTGLGASHLNLEVFRGPLVLADDKAAGRMAVRRGGA